MPVDLYLKIREYSRISTDDRHVRHIAGKIRETGWRVRR